MRIQVKDGRVLFNDCEIKSMDLDVQIKANDLISKVQNDYTINELIEMAKAKAKTQGLRIDFVIEKL